MTTRPLLLDNTVLTNFALVDRADLVMRLWPTTACSTLPVLAEHRTGAARGLLPPDAWANLPLVTLTEKESLFAESLPPRLGVGERSCLAVAVGRSGLFVLVQKQLGGFVTALPVNHH